MKTEPNFDDMTADEILTYIVDTVTEHNRKCVFKTEAEDTDEYVFCSLHGIVNTSKKGHP